MAPAVVLAYGNPLREDDGVAWAVAERVRELDPGLNVLTVHQLTPELAEVLSEAESAVFVDARVGETPGELSIALIEPVERRPGMTHTIGPETLLFYSLRLFGRAPRGALVTVTGERFGMGQGLSPAAARAVPVAAERAVQLATGRAPRQSA